MLELMKKLLKNHDLGVLATFGDRPHTSLMSYITGDDGRLFYMMTLEGTRKFSNLTQNPQVGFLVDTRADNLSSPNPPIKALSINGIARAIDDQQEHENLRRIFAERFPHLDQLVNHEDARVIAVQIRSLLLLDGPTESFYTELS